MKNAHVCTRNLARAHLDLYSYRLEDVARHLGVLKTAQKHRALGDVMLAAAVHPGGSEVIVGAPRAA